MDELFGALSVGVCLPMRGQVWVARYGSHCRNAMKAPDAVDASGW
jgi:hypothetical protein